MSSKVIAGRYELLQKIGDGGMAVVYKSRDRLLNRFIAVKILKPEYSNDAKFIENFKKESHGAKAGMRKMRGPWRFRPFHRARPVPVGTPVAPSSEPRAPNPEGATPCAATTSATHQQSKPRPSASSWPF